MPRAKAVKEPAVIQDFPLDGCTPSQREVMAYVNSLKGSRGLVWWMGGVRAGKSYGSCIAMMAHQASRSKRQYMVLAYTAGQGLQIFGSALQEIGEAMGYECKLTRGANPRLAVVETGNEFLFKGADKEGRDKSIQGLTLSGLIVDEVPNLLKDAIHQAEARVSDPGALRIYTCNKTSPYHWTTKYYLNRLKEGKLNGLVVDCSLEDNPHIDSEYAEELSREFEGSTLTRFIDNEFTLDHQPLYNTSLTILPWFEVVSQEIVSIYGHHRGFEYIRAKLGHNKGEEPMGLMLYGAGTVAVYEDIPIEHGDRILLNQSQSIVAKRLYRRGHHVQGYRDSYSQPESEIMVAACKAGQVSIAMESSLVEPVMTTHKPGDYRWPIMRAFEALALPLRSHVS